MRSLEEIEEKIIDYQEQLLYAVEEKNLYGKSLSPDIDLLIFALIDKLEILLWITEQDPDGEDLLNKLHIAKN
ncbi:MAG: hypothetical protein PHN35_01035 [Clostridia bacterium]|nr:hypothetical protein [Clostridia bacterium]MDD4798401.1 hypothetical protein [Clostridia bacterium]